MPNAVVPLERLRPVPLRTAWPNEAQNFTPWLAESDSLALLGAALGLELELVSVETAVGDFSADILAQETGSGRQIVIENQLESADHRHLGQIITYAAGLDAKILIWIAQRFSDQHIAAIDFLNNSTTEEYSFFGVEINLFEVGNGTFVPSFSVRTKPNGWIRMAHAERKSAEAQTSPSQELYRRFWSSLIEEAASVYPALARRTPYKGSWQTAERLRSMPGLAVEANAAFTGDSRLRVEIYIGGQLAKAVFATLHEKSNEFEAAFGETLSWELLEERQDSRIACYMPGLQRRENEMDWPLQRAWLLEKWPKLADCFRAALKALNQQELEKRSVADNVEELN